MRKRIDPTLEHQNYQELRSELEKRLRNGLPPLIRLPNYFPRVYLEDETLARRVSVYNLPMFEGFGNGKTPPAHQLLVNIEKETNGRFPKKLAVASSGNTVANIAQEAPGFGAEKVAAILEATVPSGKIGQIRKANRDVEILNPPPGMSTIEFAEEFSRRNGYYFVNQYTAKGSVEGHLLFTWPHVARELKKYGLEPSIVCVALGTTSAFVSAHWLKGIWPKVQIVGTACCPGEVIPGARSEKKLEATGFGYKNLIEDRLVLCSLESATEMCDDLYRHGSFSAGYTTGMSVAAAFDFINQRKRLFYENNEEVVVVTLGMDAAAPYYADRA